MSYQSLSSGPVNPMVGSSCGCGGCGSSQARPLSVGILGASQGCSVAAPPPRRSYCQPAPFSSCCGGQKYFNLQQAYGSSVQAQY